MNTRVKTRPNMMEERSSFSSDFWGVLHTCVYTPTPPHLHHHPQPPLPSIPSMC